MTQLPGRVKNLKTETGDELKTGSELLSFLVQLFFSCCFNMGIFRKRFLIRISTFAIQVDDDFLYYESQNRVRFSSSHLFIFGSIVYNRAIVYKRQNFLKVGVHVNIIDQ